MGETLRDCWEMGWIVGASSKVRDGTGALTVQWDACVKIDQRQRSIWSEKEKHQYAVIAVAATGEYDQSWATRVRQQRLKLGQNEWE